ncbi:hypothetical protein [Facklamia hominis]|uniref:hypothetical protein n=2 Tax=Facklamia hominis TaxID=178214 RepID=UPI000353DB12|nr:hypothetical protein [Facklamia hominis]EPH07732.1 hypothetical protein HMPREF9260_01730 [Facklamia hominis ACS-120-V-Sch10]PKY92529.1 hypothetical protein CYJ56_07380 [Facklamia hominis]WPJ90968.1 hypothetical protein R0V13_00795 [Facklamia hominis]
MMHLPLWSGLAPDLVITLRLEEVLARIRSDDLILNIEFKTNVVFYSGIEEAVWALVQGYDLADSVLISSFNYALVLRFKGLAKNTPEEYGFLIDHALESPSKSLKE